MRKNLLFVLFIITFTLHQNLTAQVGIGTTNPNGALEVTSATDGMLVPRVTLTATNTATVITPTESELVYNTNTSAAGPNQVTPGFYYWNGTLWVRLLNTQNNDWSITGNTGTNSGTNFLGTTDNQSLVLRTNNTERARILNSGNIGIGDTTPAALLTVGNGDLMQVVSTGHTRTINGTPTSPAFSFTGDTNTGMFHNAALSDDIGISTGGVQRLWISDAGEVYAGTTAPALPGDLFNATATNTNAVTSGSGNLTWAVNGYTAYNGGGIYGLRLAGATGTWGAIQGETSASNPANSPGISGTTSAASHIGVRGFHPAGTGWGGIFYNDLGYTGGVYNASDRSLKKNINSLNNAVSILSQIQIYSYEYKTDEYDVLGERGELHYGVMADELKQVLPDLVKNKSLDGVVSRSNKEEIKNVKNRIDMVNYVELVPIAVQAIKEQQKTIEEQKKRIDRLEKLVESLLNKN